MMKKATVTITTFQRPEFVKIAIESVFRQSYNNIEIVLVDDNGYGTQAQIETETSISNYLQLENFKYIKLDKNAGSCEARNIGVKNASGDYLFFLDDDDVFLPRKVEKQIALLENNPHLDGTLCAFKRLNTDGTEITADSNYPVVGDFKNFIINGNFFTPMLCIRKVSFDQSSGFKSIPRFQDRYFMINCLHQGMNFTATNEALYVMNEHMQDRITNLSTQKTIFSLDLIRTFVLKRKSEFSVQEWNRYLERDDTVIAISYYFGSYPERINSIYYWTKCLVAGKKWKYLQLIFKSLIPKEMLKI